MLGLVVFVLAVLAALALLSLVYGVDSRDGSMDPRRPIYPVGLR